LGPLKLFNLSAQGDRFRRLEILAAGVLIALGLEGERELVDPSAQAGQAGGGRVNPAGTG